MVMVGLKATLCPRMRVVHQLPSSEQRCTKSDPSPTGRLNTVFTVQHLDIPRSEVKFAKGATKQTCFFPPSSTRQLRLPAFHHRDGNRT